MSYKTARDLPSFVELRNQLNGIRALSFMLPKEQRREIQDVKSQLDEMASLVDDFYDILGEKHWVFHDRVELEKYKHVVSAKDSHEAQSRFIELYDESLLRIAVLRCNGFVELRKRKKLVEQARDDFLCGRYYSCIFILISVADGFVNDIEKTHRGLHTRTGEELSQWDSVISHHQGIASVHRIFTKQISVTIEEPVYELYRNGIMHGTVTNFDNIVVAAKAWNLLFATMDWAEAKLKAEKPKPQKATWKGIIRQIIENQEDKRLLSEWKPSTLNAKDDGIEKDEVYILCQQYLQLWRDKNYGQMATFLMADTRRFNGNAAPKKIRDEYKDYQLERFEITKVSHEAAAISEIEAKLSIGGEDKTGKLRWVYEDVSGNIVPSNKGTGAWRLVLWGPLAFLNRLEK